MKKKFSGPQIVAKLRQADILISPASKRRAIEHICRKLGISQRRACKALSQHRSSQRYKPKQPEKDKPLIRDILRLSLKHPRYGYRRITILLREDDWLVNFKRVYRLWCQEGLRVRKKQHKKLYYTGTSANSCDRKRPEYYNQIGVCRKRALVSEV